MLQAVHPTAKEVLSTVMHAASQARHKVELIPYELDKLSAGFRRAAFMCDEMRVCIQIIKNAQSRLTRRQVYAHTGVFSCMLSQYDIVVFYVAPPGYVKKILVVPTKDLARTFDFNGKASVSLYIPLKYRPENPVFDFWAYEDKWGISRDTLKAA